VFAAELPASLFEGLAQLIARLAGRVLFEVPGYAVCAGLYPDCDARTGLVFALSLGFWLVVVGLSVWLYRRRRPDSRWG